MIDMTAGTGRKAADMMSAGLEGKAVDRLPAGSEKSCEKVVWQSRLKNYRQNGLNRWIDR